jgi:HK97 family phage major capsid protein
MGGLFHARKKGQHPMETTVQPTNDVATDKLEQSFDIVERQDKAEVEIAGLRSDVDEVKARLDKVSRAASRPAIAGASSDQREVKGFVDGYLRRGRETEVKSINGATPGDGGFAVPQVIDAMIARELTEISPIRGLAQVVQTGTSGYRKLVSIGGTASGWVSETAPRPETDTPEFAEIAPPSGDLYANPAASQAMLDDAAFDLESWLANEIAIEFARAEGMAFVDGTGVNQPEGFLRAPTSTAEDGVRAFKTLQYIGSGDANGFDASPEAKLIDLIHSLKSGHRQGASFVMNSATLATVRKLKTADGAFLWQPGMVEGQPDRLLGYPVVEAEDMPDVAGGAYPIAFGNFRHGYLIAEHSATRVLRDPFSNKPFVHFYATKRVGGQVLDSNAIKLLKIEA